MKPLHAKVAWLSRCPCCVSKYSRHRNGSHKRGNSAARAAWKRDVQKGVA